MRSPRRQMQPFTRRWSVGKPSITIVLLAVHGGAFAAQFVIEFLQNNHFIQLEPLTALLGLRAATATAGAWWQFLTFPFLHEGPWPFHVLTNMLLLYFAGREVEPIVGARHFLSVYIGGIALGAAAHFFLMPGETLVGISAGVAALLVAYSTILPELEVTANLFFILPLRIRAKYIALSAIFLSVALWIAVPAAGIGPASILTGALFGWLYVKQLGYGNPLALQRYIFDRR
ncbi:MAG TPA: rhomboid family intramembrane serine protease, partial [Chthoniobacteraceae bacterium]|nr:rhomboid family intramembrane serine protease [Chthoniobacteraceae bacterium]